MGEEKLLKVILRHSVNSGDYVPDYKYEQLAEAIKRLIRQAFRELCNDVAEVPLYSDQIIDWLEKTDGQ